MRIFFGDGRCTRKRKFFFVVKSFSLWYNKVVCKAKKCLPKVCHHSRQADQSSKFYSLDDWRRRRFARAIRRQSELIAVQTVIALATRLSQKKKLSIVRISFLCGGKLR